MHTRLAIGDVSSKDWRFKESIVRFFYDSSTLVFFTKESILTFGDDSDPAQGTGIGKL